MAEFCTVKRAVAAYVVDGPDDDTDPDRLPVQGQLTLTPVLGGGDAVTMVEDGTHVTVVPRPIDARISDGVILHRGREGVRLLAGGEQMNPPRLVWKARFFNMQAGGWSFKLSPIVFEVIPGGEVDLTLVAPVANVPEGIVRGPAGTSLHDIVPENGELVVTVSDDAGVRELRRIPLDDVVRAEADAAAEAAAAGVRDDVATDRKAAEDARDDSQSAARTAAEDAVSGIGERMRDEFEDQATRAEQAKSGAETAQRGAETARDDARGEVTRQISDVIDGAPEDLDTLRELAEYASENRDMLDQVNEAIANKANKKHEHVIEDVDGLQDALDTKVGTTTLGNRLYGTSAGGSQSEIRYASAPTGLTVPFRRSNGQLEVGQPSGDTDATPRSYVDSRTPQVAVVDALPGAPDPNTIYLVRE